MLCSATRCLSIASTSGCRSARLTTLRRHLATRRKAGHGHQDFVSTVLSAHSTRLRRLEKSIIDAEQCRKAALHRAVENATAFVEELEGMICQPHARLMLMGSLATALAAKDSSDIDIAFVPHVGDPKRRKQFYDDVFGNVDVKRAFVEELLAKTMHACESLGRPVKESLPLPNVQPPYGILFFEDGGTLDVQIPEPNFQAVRNTHLIRVYAATDERFPQLVHWFKGVCDALETRNSKVGLLSSYHITALCLHFLMSPHAMTQPVLPILVREKSSLYSPEMSISKLCRTLRDPVRPDANQASIGELIVRFVDYYNRLLDSGHVVRIKLANGTGKYTDQVSASAPGKLMLQIFDPYGNLPILRSAHAVNAFYCSMVFLRRKMFAGQMLTTWPNHEEEAKHFKSATQQMAWKRAAEVKAVERSDQLKLHANQKNLRDSGTEQKTSRRIAVKDHMAS